MGNFYIQLSGPTETESHWWKNLQPGETFTTVPVCVGSTLGKFDDAMGELTKYRRMIRRKNADNEKLCVIFNDYMNACGATQQRRKSCRSSMRRTRRARILLRGRRLVRGRLLVGQRGRMAASKNVSRTALRK